MDVLQTILMAAYIIGYVVITIIQQSQIKTLKEQTAGFRTYAEIFDPKKTKEYVAIMEEAATNKALNLLHDDPKLNKIMNDALEKGVEPVRDIYMRQMGIEHIELFALAYNTVVQNMDDEHNLSLILKKLPATGGKILGIIKEATGEDLRTKFKVGD